MAFKNFNDLLIMEENNNLVQSILYNFAIKNILLIIILFYILINYITTSLHFTLILILLVLIIYYILEVYFGQTTDYGKKVRVYKCLSDTNAMIRQKQTFSNFSDRPLKDYYINTSNKSYLPCNQNFDISTSESIRKILQMGARAITLDCFSSNISSNVNEDNIPVVAHGIMNKNGDYFLTSKVLFEDCIKEIVNFSKTTTDPIIVCLDLKTNNSLITNRLIRNIIITEVDNKLLDIEYKIATKENRRYFFNQSIKNLSNKIIFIANSMKSADPELLDIMDGSFDEDGFKLITNGDNINKQQIVNDFIKVRQSESIINNFSNNYDPIKYWKNGIQMVGLNFQSLDSYLKQNIKMFNDANFVLMSDYL